MKKTIAILALMVGVSSAWATTNEISVQVTLKVNKDAVQIDRASGTQLIQMSGKRYNTQTITTTTTNQALTKGSVQSAGWAYARNLSTNAADQVWLSFDNGTTTSLVFEAKEPALFRLAPAAVVSNFVVSANAGQVDFEFTVIED